MNYMEIARCRQKKIQSNWVSLNLDIVSPGGLIFITLFGRMCTTHIAGKTHI